MSSSKQECAKADPNYMDHSILSQPLIATDVIAAAGYKADAAMGSRTEGNVLPSAQQILSLSAEELEAIFGSTVQALKRKEKKQEQKSAVQRKKLLFMKKRQKLRAVEDGWNNPINAKLGEISRINAQFPSDRIRSNQKPPSSQRRKRNKAEDKRKGWGKGEESSDSELRKVAEEHVLEREAVLEQLFAKLRPFSSAGPRVRLDKSFSPLVSRLAMVTLRCVTAILRWKACFTKEKEFLLCAKDQEPVNYLLKIASSMRPLSRRPAVLTFLKTTAEEIISNPLLCNTEYAGEREKAEESQAIDGLKREERVHGKLQERWQSCTWCGITPKCPKRGQVPFGACSACKSKYCQLCISANSDSSNAFAEIRLKTYWVCQLCQRKQELETKVKKKKQRIATRKKRKLKPIKRRKSKLADTQASQESSLHNTKSAAKQKRKQARASSVESTSCSDGGESLTPRAWLLRRTAEARQHKEKQTKALLWIRWRCNDPLAAEEDERTNVEERSCLDGSFETEKTQSIRGTVKIGRVMFLVVIRSRLGTGAEATLFRPSLNVQEGPLHLRQKVVGSKSVLAYEEHLVDAYKTFCKKWIQEKINDSRIKILHRQKVQKLQAYLKELRGHLDLQRSAYFWLRGKCTAILSHQVEQISTKASLCNGLKRFKAHHTQRCSAKQDLVTHANKIQAHRDNQKTISLELCSMANHLKVHNFAKQRVVADLREAIANVASR